ncbi:hypothetical protein U1Q18_015223, partial [Sarracenia purpurea var. burkii]
GFEQASKLRSLHTKSLVSTTTRTMSEAAKETASLTNQAAAAEEDLVASPVQVQRSSLEKGNDKFASSDQNYVIRVENSEEEEGPDPDPISGSSPIRSPKCPPDKKSSSSKRKKKRSSS